MTHRYQPTCMKWLRIEMIPSKLSYFLSDGYFASFSPFLNLFFVSLGLSGTQAGLITGISLAVSVFAAPIWGFLADLTGKRKLFYLILCIGAALSVFSMPWVAQSVGKYKINTTSYANHTLTNDLNSTQNRDDLQNPMELFYVLLFINIIARSFFGALPCYIDGIVTNVVNTRELETSYGTQKVFSPIGYAFFNFLSGVAIDNIKITGFSSFTASFLVFLPCILLLTPIGYVLISQSKWEDGSNQQKGTKGLGKQLLSICKKLDTIMFLLSVTVSGLGLGIFQGFCFLLMEELKTTKTIMALAVVVSTISQLLIYPFALRIIKLVRSPIPCIAIGIFSYFPRYMLMSYIENPWLILVVQLFDGIGLSLSWSAQVEHTYASFPIEVKMSAITIVSSIHFVGAGSIANVIGGWLYRDYGARSVFRVFGIVCGGWSIIMSTYFMLKYVLVKKTSIIPYEHNDGNSVVVNTNARFT